ncbi:hypothetical protein HPTD01_2277 [Halomonas sp. TD01]|nr:hypothetical protein HPTD01_2277 [Halomonas sp. TD01]
MPVFVTELGVISVPPKIPFLADSGQANFGDAELHIRESWH